MDILSLLATDDLPPGLERDANSLQALLRFVAELDDVGVDKINLAVVHLLLRLVETYLLADAKVLDIARYRDAFLGRADQEIERRVQELVGTQPPAILVRHLRKCLFGDTAQSGRKAAISDSAINEVFQRVSDIHPRKEVRCVICGYWFRQDDLGNIRQALATDAGLRLATEFDPGRLNDDMKPAAYSQLEIDHIVPEEGLGWTEIDNLQITCQFCNRGRLIFRRSLEPISTMIAGALSAFPETRGHRITRQVIVVAAIRSSGSTCTRCGATCTDRELTAQLRTDNRDNRMWCVPWNLEVLCYRCRDATA